MYCSVVVVVSVVLVVVVAVVVVVVAVVVVSAPASLARLPIDSPEAQNIGRTHCFATILPFRAPAASLV